MKNLSYLAAITLVMLSITSCNNQSKTSAIAKAEKPAIHNQGVNISYTDTGKNDTTLLFVHGWAINKTYWSNQATYFGKQYRVVTIDLPGFGQSGKNRDKWGTPQYSNDIDSVIRQLDLKKVILIGHSMSGDIVLQAAIDNPDKVIGVVGVDNFKNTGQPQSPNAKKEMAAAIAEMRANFKSISAQWFNQQLFSKTTSTAIKNRILNDVAHNDASIAVNALEQGDDFDELSKLQQYKKKLYLINSDVTPTETKYIAAKKIPHQIYYTHGTGHFAMIEMPDAFNKDLDKVIDDINKNP